MSATTDQRRRDAAYFRRLLKFVEDGDAIVGHTPQSLALRQELVEKIAHLEGKEDAAA